jgi:hypothetical protein
MLRKLTKSEYDLLKNSGYSERAIKFYADMVNFGFMENSDVSLDYTGPLRRFHEVLSEDR